MIAIAAGSGINMPTSERLLKASCADRWKKLDIILLLLKAETTVERPFTLLPPKVTELNSDNAR